MVGWAAMSASTPAPALTRVAVYHRRVAASAARVWENVRDWEHLPWLHRTSFRSIALADEGAWGWRARVGLPPDPGGPEIDLELRIDPDAPRYVARTLAGPGAGSEIWTRVTAAGPRETDVTVEFWLSGVAPAQADALGAAYTALYRRLWDEDEAMMRRRSAALDGPRAATARAESVPATLELGPLAALRARLPLCVELAGARWRLLELDGALVAHAAHCPHWQGPLEDAPVEDGIVTCPWHGWRFDLRSGRSADGRGARLPAAPRVELAGGSVRLVAAR
jgi:nitrite reductase/ring-hydroxylating ferredoxin subunit